MALRTLIVILGLVVTLPAAAQEPEPHFAIGAGAHLLSSIQESCKASGDVQECKLFSPFVGGDLSFHYWPLSWLALGVRGAGSKDLDASESISSTGESEDRDEWLWRFSAEARLYPPILPSSMFFAGEIGAAVLVDGLDEFDAAGKQISSDSATQSALLLGAAFGWDFLQGEHLSLGLDARVQLMAFSDDPPELKPDVASEKYGSSLWASLGARLGYRW